MKIGSDDLSPLYSMQLACIGGHAAVVHMLLSACGGTLAAAQCMAIDE